MSTLILIGLAALVTAIGIIGLVVPILPGPLLIFAGLVLAAWAEGFAEVGGLTITVLALLTVVALVVDVIGSAAGVKGSGASQRAAWGAVIGAIIGLGFGWLGILLGPLIGAFLGELSVHNRIGRAGRAGFGAWLGFVIGTAGKVVIGFAMIAVFVGARWLY